MSQAGKYALGSGVLPPIETLTMDDGSVVAPDGAGNIDVFGSAGANGAINIKTDGTVSGLPASTAGIRLTDSILLPATNAAATQGVIAFGSTSYAMNRFIHSYGTDNTFIGLGAGNFSLNTGSAVGNVGVGLASLDALTTGHWNSGVGWGSLSSATTTSSNSCIGLSALANLATGTGGNSAIGYRCLEFLVSGDYNIAAGYQAGVNYTTNESSNIVIGNGGTALDANTIRLGFQGSGSRQQNKCFIAGIIGVTVANTQLVTINSSTGQLGVTALQSFSWSVITANQTAAVNNGYFCNKAGTLALALPATSAVGDVIEVYNMNTATGTQFTQAAGQQIFIGNTSTTLGAAGTLTSIAVGDSLKLVCSAANTTWRVVSMVGNWTPA